MWTYKWHYRLLYPLHFFIACLETISLYSWHFAHYVNGWGPTPNYPYSIKNAWREANNNE